MIYELSTHQAFMSLLFSTFLCDIIQKLHQSNEVARANMYKDRTEIMRFSEELLDNNSSPGEWDSLETARKNLQTKVKTAEKNHSQHLFLHLSFRVKCRMKLAG
jgi:hypothetical protein